MLPISGNCRAQADGNRNSVEPAQDGRINIELFNWPFLHELRGTSPVSTFAIERGWLWKHESGTYVKFTRPGS
jgi:hypothetical protein